MSRIGLYRILLLFQMTFLVAQFILANMGSLYILKNELEQRSFTDLANRGILLREIIPANEFQKNKLSNKSLLRLSRVCEKGKIRVTLMNTHGNVFYDSDHNYHDMENHAGRPEMSSALRGNSGKSIRFSHTLQKKMFYYAIPYLSNGEIIGVLRIAFGEKKVTGEQLRIFRFLGIINFLILFITALLVSVFTHRLISIIRKIEITALKIGRGEPLSDLPHPISRELSSLVNTLLNMAEEIKSQQKELTRISLEDSLTGLGNRRKFDEDLESLWQLCRRTGAPLSFVMIDIDFFKKYNDELGHPAGDKCLKQLAELLNRTVLRQTDIVVRLGGEEFGILMPDTDIDGAVHIAKQIHEELDRVQFPHPDSIIASYLTISTGIASITPSEGITSEVLFDHADKALYMAKNNGRNRIEIYSG